MPHNPRQHVVTRYHQVGYERIRARQNVPQRRLPETKPPPLRATVTPLTDPANNSTTYGYTPTDHVATETDPRGKVTSYVYDGVGNLTQKTDRDNRVTQYGFGPDNRPMTETWVNPLGGAALNLITMTYDAAGRETGVNDVYSDYASTCDDANHLKTVDNAGTPNDPHVVSSYSYDNASNRTGLDDSLGGLTSYTYDSRNDGSACRASPRLPLERADPLRYRQADIVDRRRSVGRRRTGRMAGEFQRAKQHAAVSAGPFAEDAQLPRENQPIEYRLIAADVQSTRKRQIRCYLGLPWGTVTSSTVSPQRGPTTPYCADAGEVWAGRSGSYTTSCGRSERQVR